MAFATGEACAYIQPAANANYLERDGNFLFGVIAAIAADAQVLWSDGKLVSSIPLVALDKINPGASTPLLGKTVRPIGPVSPEFTGVVVRTYTRQPGGTGTETALYALVKLLSNDTFIEIPATQLEVAPGR